MVKPKEPVSPQPDINTGHPLLQQMTQTDQFLKNAQKRREDQEFQIAELETWKQTVKAIASTPDGLLFLNCMVQFSGMHKPPDYRNTMKMVDVRLKSAFYLECVRPYLTPTQKGEVE